VYLSKDWKAIGKICILMGDFDRICEGIFCHFQTCWRIFIRSIRKVFFQILTLLVLANTHNNLWKIILSFRWQLMQHVIWGQYISTFRWFKMAVPLSKLWSALVSKSVFLQKSGIKVGIYYLEWQVHSNIPKLLWVLHLFSHYWTPFRPWEWKLICIQKILKSEPFLIFHYFTYRY
jgi:hypothetical protein